MKRLSDETSQLVYCLYQSTGLIAKAIEDLESPLSILEKIGNEGELAVIPSLLHFIKLKDREIVLAVAKTIHQLTSQLTALDLFDLDDHFRAFGYYFSYDSNIFQPAEEYSIDFTQPYQVSVLGMLSFHRNGYVREYAIDRLRNSWTGDELPFFLIRLDEWVPVIQKAAFNAVSSRLKPSYAKHFINCLPLVERLSRRQRMSQVSLARPIIEMLVEEQSRPAMVSGFESSDRAIRRACFRIAIEAKSVFLLENIQLASKEKDPQVRLWSARKVRELEDPQEFSRLMALFRVDRCMTVRREALRIFIEKNPQIAEETLQNSLLDTHASLRYEARYRLAQYGIKDFAAFYRNALLQDKQVFPAINGLGETGSELDVELIRPYITHQLPKFRLACLKALSKLQSYPDINLFLQMVLDPSSKVSTEAAKVLAGNPYILNPLQLWESLERAAHVHAKANLVWLISHLPKWESIYYLLKAAFSEDEWISKPAIREIYTWRSHYNKSFLQPTALQIQKLRNLLNENGDHLKMNIRNNLMEILASW